VRGTDVWGKSSGERQVVCLIEDAVQAPAPGERAAGYAAEIAPVRAHAQALAAELPGRYGISAPRVSSS